MGVHKLLRFLIENANSVSRQLTLPADDPNAISALPPASVNKLRNGGRLCALVDTYGLWISICNQVAELPPDSPLFHSVLGCPISEFFFEDADVIGGETILVCEALRRFIITFRDVYKVDLVFARDAPRGLRKHDESENARERLWDEREILRFQESQHAYDYCCGAVSSKHLSSSHRHTSSSLSQPHSTGGNRRTILPLLVFHAMQEVLRELNITLATSDQEVDDVVGDYLQLFNADLIITGDTDFVVTPHVPVVFTNLFHWHDIWNALVPTSVSPYRHQGGDSRPASESNAKPVTTVRVFSHALLADFLKISTPMLLEAAAIAGNDHTIHVGFDEGIFPEIASKLSGDVPWNDAGKIDAYRDLIAQSSEKYVNASNARGVALTFSVSGTFALCSPFIQELYALGQFPSNLFPALVRGTVRRPLPPWKQFDLPAWETLVYKRCEEGLWYLLGRNSMKILTALLDDHPSLQKQQSVPGKRRSHATGSTVPVCSIAHIERVEELSTRRLDTFFMRAVDSLASKRTDDDGPMGRGRSENLLEVMRSWSPDEREDWILHLAANHVPEGTPQTEAGLMLSRVFPERRLSSLVFRVLFLHLLRPMLYSTLELEIISVMMSFLTFSYTSQSPFVLSEELASQRRSLLRLTTREEVPYPRCAELSRAFSSCFLLLSDLYELMDLLHRVPHTSAVFSGSILHALYVLEPDQWKPLIPPHVREHADQCLQFLNRTDIFGPAIFRHGTAPKRGVRVASDWIGTLQRDELVDLLDGASTVPREESRISLGLIQPTAAPPSPEFTQEPSAPLPILQHMSAALEHIDRCDVLCIHGETGCGKSSMLPLHVYQQYTARQQHVQIIVTQPRRIAAVSLARRVAALLHEDVGETCGYRIGGGREFHREGPRTRIRYVTTGYLLEALINGCRLWNAATHLFLDEVHERSLEADMLSLVVRLRQAAEPSPKKLILMSATLQQDLFAAYFLAAVRNQSPGSGNSPVEPPPALHVGVRRFPVQEYFIEDVIGMVGPSLPPAVQSSIAGLLQRVKNPKAAAPHIRPCDYSSIANLILAASKPGMCILVFLPGIGEIEGVFDELHKTSQRYGVFSQLRLFALHSIVDIEDQRRAVEPTPSNQSKIVLATNIAETSLTIPDVKLVIDLGMSRRIEFDEAKNIRTLVCGWCTRSALVQRAGRAGRVSEGTVFRLFPRSVVENMKAFDAAEIMPLEYSVLQVHARMRQYGDVRDVMQLLIEPPDPLQVERALRRLVEWGALSPNDFRLLELGSLALHLPIDVSLTRAVIAGAALGCTAEMVVIAAGLTIPRPMFQHPLRVFYQSEGEFIQQVVRTEETLKYFDRDMQSDLHMFLSVYEETCLQPRSALQNLAKKWMISVRQVVTFLNYVANVSKRLLQKPPHNIQPDDLALLERLSNPRNDDSRAPPPLPRGPSVVGRQAAAAPFRFAVFDNPNRDCIFRATLALCSEVLMQAEIKTHDSEFRKAGVDMRLAPRTVIFDSFPQQVVERHGLEMLEKQMSRLLGPIECFTFNAKAHCLWVTFQNASLENITNYNSNLSAQQTTGGGGGGGGGQSVKTIPSAVPAALHSIARIPLLTPEKKFVLPISKDNNNNNTDASTATLIPFPRPIFIAQQHKVHGYLLSELGSSPVLMDRWSVLCATIEAPFFDQTNDSVNTSKNNNSSSNNSTSGGNNTKRRRLLIGYSVLRTGNALRPQFLSCLDRYPATFIEFYCVMLALRKHLAQIELHLLTGTDQIVGLRCHQFTLMNISIPFHVLVEVNVLYALLLPLGADSGGAAPNTSNSTEAAPMPGAAAADGAGSPDLPKNPTAVHSLSPDAWRKLYVQLFNELPKMIACTNQFGSFVPLAPESSNRIKCLIPTKAVMTCDAPRGFIMDLVALQQDIGVTALMPSAKAWVLELFSSLPLQGTHEGILREVFPLPSRAKKGNAGVSKRQGTGKDALHRDTVHLIIPPLIVKKAGLWCTMCNKLLLSGMTKQTPQLVSNTQFHHLALMHPAMLPTHPNPPSDMRSSCVPSGVDTGAMRAPLPFVITPPMFVCFLKKKKRTHYLCCSVCGSGAAQAIPIPLVETSLKEQIETHLQSPEHIQRGVSTTTTIPTNPLTSHCTLDDAPIAPLPDNNISWPSSNEHAAAASAHPSLMQGVVGPFSPPPQRHRVEGFTSSSSSSTTSSSRGGTPRRAAQNEQGGREEDLQEDLREDEEKNNGLGMMRMEDDDDLAEDD